jgi:hypothetical protein
MDRITENAAKLFNIKPEEVTLEQRNITKMWMHGENFSSGGIKMGRLVGQYPIKVEPF